MRRTAVLVSSVILFFVLNAFAQVDAYIQMDFEGPVELVVTDSQGKRCGYNPFTGTIYNEISYAGYGYGSDGSAKEFAFNTALKDTSFSTTYTIQLFGTRKGAFTGDGGAEQTWSGKGLNFNVLGVIDSNQTVTYKLTYTTDSTITPTMTKVVTPHIIIQDFNDCFKLRLLGDREFYRELRNQLDNFNRHIEHRDSVEARRELESFWNRIQYVYSDTVDNDNANHHAETRFEHRLRGFVTQEAYQILNEDVNLMLAQLPVETHRGDHYDGRGKR